MSKKKHEEHENHERWLVSYADFITLLFAFFVVMYSISSVNEGRFRTVSESIKAALNPIVSPPAAPVPFQIGANKPSSIVPNSIPSRDTAIRRLYQVVKALQASTQLEAIRITEAGDSTIVLSLPDFVLFESGAASLRAEALPFLQVLAEVLVELDRQVKVQGHTDNLPIRTAQFPSNWELSSIRAVMVVRALSELYGVPVQNLSAVGYADSRPVTDNTTPENRAKNRRVEIVVMEKQELPVSDGKAEGPNMPERAPVPVPAAAPVGAEAVEAAVSDEIPAALRPPAASVPDGSPLPAR
ncbi:MAG: OmpA family protein [Nitrospira sp.]|nr:OmpA family protein [Nitrospira sp.]